MQTVNGCSSRSRKILTICVLLASFVFVSLPALAQGLSQTTMTGTVVSYGTTTLVVKGEGKQYVLFVFDKHTVKPATLELGSGVRVISTQTEDPAVRLAALVTVTEAPAPRSAATPAEPDVVPASIRGAESAIERDVRKYHFGIQGGMTLDSEAVDIGIHAKFGPFFSSDVQFRPSVDFAYGEITKAFSLSGDFIYVPSGSRAARRSFYFGGGPQFNFVSQSAGVDFSEFHYSTALNVILGVRMRNGVFTEMKTSLWAKPAPIFRLIVGYTF